MSRIYIGGLPQDVSRAQLEGEFEHFGQLKDVWVATNPPGFGFIVFEDAGDADNAVKEMNGKLVFGTNIRVEVTGGPTREMCSMNSSWNKFRGSLVGALLGDCLGAPFEGRYWGHGMIVEDSVIKDEISPEKLEKKKKGFIMVYTDDTAMTKSICLSLLHCKKFDPVDMATRFTKEYISNEDRGYGWNATDIFTTWNSSKITPENVLLPSTNQFDGSGSYGNGGAMRVAPVALFVKSAEECISVSESTARLTHNNRFGYLGTVLQALAVYKCVHASGRIDWKEFIQDLMETMKRLENNSPVGDSQKNEADCENLYEWTRCTSFTYTHQLGIISELLTSHHENPTVDDRILVVERLGRDISAQQSVPAAIYCFLRNVDYGFERTLYYAISLGGDTDTIGSMCCAMAGGYYGYDSIPPVWKNVCESHDEVVNFADQFYALH